MHDFGSGKQGFYQSFPLYLYNKYEHEDLTLGPMEREQKRGEQNIPEKRLTVN